MSEKQSTSGERLDMKELEEVSNMLVELIRQILRVDLQVSTLKSKVDKIYQMSTELLTKLDGTQDP